MATTTNQKKFVWEYLDGTTKEFIIPEENLLSTKYSRYASAVMCVVDLGCDEGLKFDQLHKTNDLLLTEEDYADFRILHDLYFGCADNSEEEKQRIDEMCSRIRIGKTHLTWRGRRDVTYPSGILIPYKFCVQYKKNDDSWRISLFYLKALVSNLHMDHIYAIR